MMLLLPDPEGPHMTTVTARGDLGPVADAGVPDKAKSFIHNHCLWGAKRFQFKNHVLVNLNRISVQMAYLRHITSRR